MRSLAVLGMLTAVVLFALSPFASAGGPAPLTILKGPWVQNVTTTAITVMWQTNLAGDSRVDYGPTASYGQHVSHATAMTLHEVRLTGLTLDARYHYHVTSAAATSVSSADHTFQTAVASGTPFRFAVYGDSRTNPADHAAVVKSILASAPRFVLHTGDIIADGTKDANWVRDFFTPAAPLIADLPLFPCLGNHERNAAFYYDYFSLPHGGGDHNERWYSFDYGDAHFTVLDTDADYAPGSPQYAWLVSDLKHAAAPWKFVVHHHPAYSSGAHGSTEKVQRYLVPLYEQYGVAMVFNGHDHHYELSQKAGVYYIVTGGGGAPQYAPNLHPNRYQQHAEETLHHCTLDISGTTATFRAVRTDGSVLDTVTLTRAQAHR